MSTWFRIGDWGLSMADHWVENHKRDSWRRQAKASGYRARSAFKLKQIQAKFELMREGDVVLDPFMGTGTTAVAAVNLEWNYIGYDIDQDYVDFATERLGLTKFLN